MKYFKIILLALIPVFSCSTKFTAEKKKEFSENLKQLAEIDQIAANMPAGKYKLLSHEQWDAFKDSVFTAHKVILEGLFNKYGFIGYDKAGKEGSGYFWLMVQHCDKFPDFQRKVLEEMDEAVKKGNANPENYAYLYDRVKINAGEKQKFGTQVTYEVDKAGRAIPKIGLDDSLHVDSLRKQYNLEPLIDYLNMMTSMHFDMNKEIYIKKGVTKPDLYITNNK